MFERLAIHAETIRVNPCDIFWLLSNTVHVLATITRENRLEMDWNAR